MSRYLDGEGDIESATIAMIGALADGTHTAAEWRKAARAARDRLDGAFTGDDAEREMAIKIGVYAEEASAATGIDIREHLAFARQCAPDDPKVDLERLADEYLAWREGFEAARDLSARFVQDELAGLKRARERGHVLTILPLRRVRCGGGRPRARRVTSKSAGGGSSGDPPLGDDDPPGETPRCSPDDVVEDGLAVLA